MTVLSVLGWDNGSMRHPMDMRHCMPAAARARGSKVQPRLTVIRCDKAQASSADLTGKDAFAFLFCSNGAQPANNAETVVEEIQKHGREELDRRRNFDQEMMNVGGVDLPPFHISNLGLLLPPAMAAHAGMLGASGAMVACLPIMAPFQVPPVGVDSWLSNKRAVAFHRCITLAVGAQGVMALMKFGGGDLIGGVYMALQAGIGAYAIAPDGGSMMTSYMMICGFNGVLNLVQVLQQAQGVPVSYLVMPLLPPVVSILATYFSWQFIKELRAIGAGMPSEGAQDSCFVKLMGSDIWPLTSLTPASSMQQAREEAMNQGSHTTGGSSQRFSAFGGNGHRLGES